MADLRQFTGRGGGRNRFAEVEHAENAGRTLRRIVAYFAREKTMVLAMLAVVIFGTLCGIYAPALQSRAIDIIAGERQGALPPALALMLIVYLLYCGSQLLQGLVSANLSQRLVKRMRVELFDCVIDLPVKYLDTHSHGDVMSRMTNDIETISTTVSQSLPSLFSGVLTLAGTVVIMVYFCWQLAILSCTTVFLTVFASRFLAKRVRKYSRQKSALLGHLNGTVEEMVSGYRTVVAYNHQDSTVEDFRGTSDDLTKAGIRAEVLSGVMGPIMNCISNVGFVIIAAFGGFFAIRGIISVGVISAFIVYAKQFSRPINEIAQVYGQLQTAVAGAERVFRVLDEEREDKSGLPLEEGETAAVSFEHVNFRFKDSDKPVINDLTLRIKKGETVAFVGQSGAGKSTLINLVIGFLRPQSGKILIDGNDLEEINLRSYRKHIAVVPQTPILFTGTLRENITYGFDDVSEEFLHQVLAASNLEELVDSLPEGLDTMIAEHGANLSGGQKQRVSIARAFVRDPKILILDEATSALDTISEKKIQDSVDNLVKDRTTLIVAHRLSTIRNADKIAVIGNGGVLEYGTYEELMAKQGEFYKLRALQV